MVRSQPVRALVLGSSGFLGQRLLASGNGSYRPLPVARLHHVSDLFSFERQVNAALQENPAAVLVNCIAARAGSLELMTLLNEGVPERILKVAACHETHVIHFGSAAEVVQIAVVDGAKLDPSAAAMSLYGDTKRAGTQACLAYMNATVLRVYNIHGLPHQPDAGLHRLCLAVRAAISGGGMPLSLIDTTRDYVHWQEAVAAAAAAIDEDSRGLVEVCSGFGISMSDIIEGLPSDVQTAIAAALVPPDFFAGVIGPPMNTGNPIEAKSALIEALRTEVLTCAFS